MPDQTRVGEGNPSSDIGVRKAACLRIINARCLALLYGHLAKYLHVLSSPCPVGHMNDEHKHSAETLRRAT